jgi:hypothetical protein
LPQRFWEETRVEQGGRPGFYRCEYDREIACNSRKTEHFKPKVQNFDNRFFTDSLSRYVNAADEPTGSEIGHSRDHAPIGTD